MWCMDGNNSLKRIAPTAKHRQADMRVLNDSDYFLARDYVDTFANEVQSKPPPKGPGADDSDDAEAEILGSSRPILDHDRDEGDPSDAVPDDSPLASCTRNWKAAAGETQKKKMWAIFDETGIFASACPHGLVLWIADMVKSGEL